MTSSKMTKAPRVIVDPCFASEWRDLNDFIGEFGPYNGRYVPSYPADWVSRMRAHVEDLDLLPRKKAEMIAKVLQHAHLCTVPESWAWNDGRSWKDNLHAIGEGLANSIVVGDAFDPEPYNAWHEVVDDIRDSRIRSFVFSGSVAEYVELCKPLLLASPAAYLIDPYVDPLSQEIEILLRRFFDLIKGSRCYSIELVRRWPYDQSMSREDFEKQLNDLYQGLVPKGRSLKVHGVVDGGKPGELRMHDRFFLTKHGALSFGHGFRVSLKGGALQNAFVVDSAHHDVLKSTYIDGVAFFKDHPRLKSEMPRPRDVVSFEVR